MNAEPDMDSEEHARQRIEQLVEHFMREDCEDLSLPSPEPGSSIDLDDAEFPLMATSHSVQSGIMAAREHLLAVAFLWRSHEGGTLMPSAYSTLVRAAIVGAGTALWILHPADRTVRLQRTTAYAVENFRQALIVEREALEEAPRLGMVSPELLNGQRRNVARASERLEAAMRAQWDSLGTAGTYTRKSLPTYSQTRAIADAATFAYRTDAKLPVFSQLLWRMASGDAHGLPWPKILRAVQTGEHANALAAPGPTVELRDVSTCETLFPLLAQGALLTHSAERLYELRRLSHAPC